jgi:TonB-linked SusC/RagA family outer membrane protein
MRRFILLIAALVVLLGAWAQQRTIRGKIIDNKGAPVVGATITVRGQSVSTQTNEAGEFTIAAATGNTLIVSSVGYGTKEISVGTDNNISVSLAEQSRELSEVVVTAGGVRREVRTLGYSAPTIRNEELTRARERSVLNSLQGKVAGVNITSSSGGVGSSTRIVFRGGTSLLGNNQALIVVDGIPIDNSQIDPGDNLNNQVDPGNRGNDINPEDVESVTVLKGPAAAALYGSRAANGALIITTKRGSRLGAKRTEVTLNSSFSLESILKLPDYQNEYGQGVDKDHPDLRENWSWGPKFDGVVRPWGQEVEGEQRVKPYVALPDNVREFFDVGQVFNNGISLSQNNERNSYYVSFNNINQKGIMPGTEYKRTSVRLTGTAELSKKFYSNATINYIRSFGDLSVQGQGPSPYDQVLQTPRDISLLELKDYKNNKFNTPAGYYGAYTINPYWFLGEDAYTSNINRVLGNIELGYRPTTWLDVIYRIGTDVTSDFRRQIRAKITIPDGNQNEDNAFPGSYSEQSINIREMTSDLIATGKFNLTDNLSLRALVGHNYRQRVFQESFSQINDLVIPNLYVLTNTAGAPTSNNLIPDYAERRLFGVYGDLNLGFKNYLFLGLTGRNDWSSTLPQGNNSFFYPSANLSFVFSDAFNMPSWLSYGKVRVSGARVGNDADPYLLQSVFVPGTISDGYSSSQVDFPFNGVPGYTLASTIGNPNLTPEFTTSYEGGVEASFFNNRLGIDATYYRNKTTDQIITLPIAASSGYTFRVSNVGQVSNKGVEVLLRGQPIRGRNFQWEVTTTFSKNKSNVDEIAEGTTRIALPGVGFSGGTLVAEVGKPYGQFFGSGFLRDSLGRVVVSATTGYPVTDPDARTYGTYQPDFMASLFNSFSFKGFTLTALLDGRKGGVFFSRTKTLQAFVGTDPKTLYNDREPFVVPNSAVLDPASGKYIENTTVKVANVINYWTTYVSNNAMENLVDASFLKLREVTLTYAFPKSMIQKLPFSGLQVGLIGRNLWLRTADENTYSDPETSSFGTGNGQGYEYGSIPSVRSYGANIRVTF